MHTIPATQLHVGAVSFLISCFITRSTPSTSCFFVFFFFFFLRCNYFEQLTLVLFSSLLPLELSPAHVCSVRVRCCMWRQCGVFPNLDHYSRPVKYAFLCRSVSLSLVPLIVFCMSVYVLCLSVSPSLLPLSRFLADLFLHIYFLAFGPLIELSLILLFSPRKKAKVPKKKMSHAPKPVSFAPPPPPALSPRVLLFYYWCYLGCHQGSYIHFLSYRS